ncbi:dynamin family protein [Lentzea cavernae]|uniref:Dynamin N-terminal domain-containing protein n=1 Tax=Lentzea cavernae TaxID=2020703 RepID=A0ABQ3MHS5_9PSEU|nr:dynamin family protein [Lentzea cavernae]GHH42686.1 hypothetical protein GCM10017774_39450 [Lentzea cavernae]
MTAVQASDDLRRLAAAVDVDGGVERLRSWRECARALGADGERWRAWLAEIAERLERPEVHVVFGGHFNFGKSTLLNTMIGRTLLPTRRLPDTGAPCVIRSGPEDRVVAVSGGKVVKLPFDTAAIADQVSVHDAAGKARHGSAAAIDRVVVTLADGVVPAGVRWIDSPGINDEPPMTERARETAADADVLVWVLSSVHPLTEPEQLFLADHAARCGDRGLLFVVNVFLDEDPDAEWSGLQRSFYETRVEEFAEEAGITCPPPVFVSARGAAQRPDAFGGHEFRAALEKASTAGKPTVRRARAGRALIALTALRAEVAQRIGEAEARLSEARNAYAEAMAAYSVHAELRRVLKESVSELVKAAGNDIEASVNQIAAGLAAPRTGDASYQRALDSRIRESVDDRVRALAAEIRAAAADTAARFGVHPPHSSLAERLYDLAAPDLQLLEVELGSGSQATARIFGGAVGAVLGAVAGPAGATAGAMAGATLAGRFGRNSTANRLALVATATREAGQREAARVLALDDALFTSALSETGGTPRMPQASDRSRLDALLVFDEQLARPAEDALVEAL